MPDYKIIVDKRIDEPGYRWRMGGETGVLSDEDSRFLFKLVRAAIEGFGSEPDDSAGNADSVKLTANDEDTADQDARSAGIALMHAAEANDCLLSDIWAGNGPPNLQAIFRGLSNRAAEFVAYLAYSDGTNDWRAKAGLPPATDEPTSDPAPDQSERFQVNVALRKLLADWFDGELSKISEHGTSRDWPALIDDAKNRHAVFGIPWTNEFVPDYVRELLAIDADEAPVRTWTYSQVNPGGADVSHGHTFTGTNAEWTEHQTAKVYEGAELFNARITND